MDTAIIKYNAGNIQSVLYALERIGKTALVTDDHEKIKSASRVIFPGVGEASTAMKYLRERGLDELIVNLEQPVLGICLGIFDGDVKKFDDHDGHAKIPQMGWNNIFDLESTLFEGVAENSFCYFVHGYYASLGNNTIGTTDYILPYSSAMHRNNFYGVQFHPEKSAKAGEQILKNFLSI